jgi:predicted RNA binding protein YcfA (HicA-like mRNA interferase family)
MPKLKVLSGPDVVRILSSFGFAIASQHGSHVKLRRVTTGGIRQTLTIPNHRELDRGTLLGIYRQALRYIPADQLAPHFYID